MDNINLRLEELNDKPDIRELTLRNGIYYPSDEELIMLILGRGTRKNPIELLSQEVIDMLNASNDENLIQNLVSIEGVGTSRALVIAAALELGRRRNSYQKKAVNKPSDIVPYVQHYSLKPTEHFVTATVNGAHELIKIRLISVGTTNRTLVHPREIFAGAVSEHASGIICCHNHPYGKCSPSHADVESTKVLQQAAGILGITFMDHIIITKNDYFSFLEHDML